jgi:hypothetical protein
MKGLGNVKFRPLVRAGVIPAVMASGMLALTAIPASAATVIGSAAGSMACVGNIDTVQETTSGVSYAVPSGGGQITSWSTNALNVFGPAGLLVWRPSATAGTYTLVAATTPVTLKAGMNTFTLTTPIAVQAGDVLGLRTQGSTDCIQSAGAGNTIGYRVGPTVAVGALETMLKDPLPLTIDVSATIGPASTPGGGGTGGGCQSGTGEKGDGDKDKGDKLSEKSDSDHDKPDCDHAKHHKNHRHDR